MYAGRQCGPVIEVEFLTDDEVQARVGKAEIHTGSVPRVGETVILLGVNTYDMKVWSVTGVTYHIPDLGDGFIYNGQTVIIFVKEKANYDQKRFDTAKHRAINIFENWNNVTGFVTEHTSYHYELQGVIEDAVLCGIQAALNFYDPLECETESTSDKTGQMK